MKKNATGMDKDIVYHYCSVNTFLNIVNNSSVYLSDVSKSNDSQELIWLENKCREHWQNNDLSGIDFNVNDILNAIQRVKCWCMCFSEINDDLGQWRGYADDGKGVAIGFDKKFLKSVVQFLNNGSIIQLASGKDAMVVDFCPINYNTDRFIKLLDQYCSKEYILSQVKKLSSKKEIDIIDFDDGDFIKKMWIMPSVLITGNIYKYKNQSFSEEKEWRLSYLTRTDLVGNIKKLLSFNELKIGDDAYAKAPVILQRVGFRNTDSQIISYIEMGIKDLGNAISEIVIGPKAKVTKADIEMFLSNKGIAKPDGSMIQVYTSDSTYR